MEERNPQIAITSKLWEALASFFRTLIVTDLEPYLRSKLMKLHQQEAKQVAGVEVRASASDKMLIRNVQESSHCENAG